MKKIIGLALCVIVAFTCLTAGCMYSSAEEETKDNYKYVVMDDGTVKLTEYQGENTEVINIPSEIDGKKVTVLGNGLFEYTDRFFEVQISERLQQLSQRPYVKSYEAAARLFRMRGLERCHRAAGVSDCCGHDLFEQKALFRSAAVRRPVLKAVCSEGVGEDDIGSGLQIVEVHLLYDFGMQQVPGLREFSRPESCRLQH